MNIEDVPEHIKKAVIVEYFRNIQKRSYLKRIKNNPHTFKDMRAVRTAKAQEQRGELAIEVE